MARPVFNIKHCSLFKIQFISSKKKKNSAITLGCSLFQWFFYTATLIFCHSSLANGRCENTAATLESVEGVVEWSIADDHWQQATRGDAFCYGDKIRILEQRAALRLANDTVVRLRENSVVTLMPEDKGFWVELVQGAGHFLSRTPKQLTIKAAYLNAAIDGTEFVVAVEDQRNRVAVFEGDVRVFNRYGEVRLGEGTETSATATTAPDPARSIRLHDAAEWILHYPPLIIQNQIDATISALMDQERYADALNRLDRQTMTSEETTLAASLALISGQPSMADRLLNLALQQNPRSPEARALQALKALTAGNDQAALSQTSALLQTDPQNISVLLAHAYALQSQGKIEEALKTNRQALSVAPDNLFILVRTAELELSSGNTRAARKLIDRALQKAPNHSRVNTLAGFIALNRFANKEAQTYFRTAINSNDSEPLARLGLALALIQKGKIEQGQAEMEMAVLLDPGSSLLRSYLGKTYAAQDQNDWADTQYQLAKNLDPNDPTPWFYQAHLKHEENKPGEALKLITTAIEKNDNRAVYRSRMLLDSDAATRSANLVSIYSSAGFTASAKNVASFSASVNPKDFATHYAAVAAYGRENEHQVLRSREAFLGRLLSPIGAKELPVGVTEVGIQVSPWLLPSRSGVGEYSSLFSRSGLKGNFSSFVGSQSTKGHEWQLQTIQNRASLSIGQFEYGTEGFAINNDSRVQIDEAVIHTGLTTDWKLVMSATSRSEHEGDLVNAVDSALFNRSLRRDRKTSSFNTATSFSINHVSQLLAYFGQSEIESTTSQSLPFPPFSIKLSTKAQAENAGIQLRSSYGKVALSMGGKTESYSSATQDAKLERLYFDVRPFIDSSWYVVAGAGVSEWSRMVQTTELRDSRVDHRLGIAFEPLDHLRISLANWNAISDYLPNSLNIEQNNILGIKTSDNTSSFTPISADAFLVIWTTGKAAITLSGFRKNYTELVLIADENRENPITDRGMVLNLEMGLTERIYFNVSAETETNEREFSRLFTFGNLPIELDRENIKLASKFLLTEKVSITPELCYFWENTQRLNTASAAEENISFLSDYDKGVIANVKFNSRFTEPRLNLTLAALNLTNEKITVFNGAIQDRIGSFLVVPAEFPHERSILLTLALDLD